MCSDRHEFLSHLLMGIREKRKSQKLSKSQSRSKQLNPFLLAAPFAAVVILHVAGWLSPGKFTWGFNFWSFIQPEIATVVFLVSLLLLLPPISSRLARAVRSVTDGFGPSGQVHRRLWLIVGMAAALAAFYLLRTRAFVYGDGYTLLASLSDGDGVQIYDQYYFQILSVYFYHYLINLLRGLTGLSVEQIYAAINAVGGVVGVAAVYRIAGQITSASSSRAFMVIGGLSSGATLLFFGHIENYTWALALALWTLSYAISWAQYRRGLPGLVALASLAFLFHMITLPFAIVAVLALFLRSGPDGNRVIDMAVGRLGLIAVVGSLLFVAVAQLVGVEIFVPLLGVRGNPYSALSPNHLIDVLNQAALVAAPGAILWLFAWYYLRRRVTAVGPEDAILALASLLSFLAAFWIDPEIGAPRDWDLLAFYGIPLSLMGLHLFTKLFSKRRVPAQLVVAMAVVTLVHLGGNLYEKNHPALAVERLDRLLYDDTHYLSTYSRAHRCVAWASVLQRGAGRDDLAIKYLMRRLNASSDSYQACFNLGDIYYRRDEYDSAAKYMTMGLKLKPDDLVFALNLTRTEQIRGNYDKAARWASHALRLDPDNVDALTQLGISLGHLQRLDESLPCFQKAYALSPDRYEQIVNLGLAHAMLGSTDSAYYYVCRALPEAPADRKVDLYCCAISSAIDLGKPEAAAHYLEQLKRFDPSVPSIQIFNAKLTAMAEE